VALLLANFFLIAAIALSGVELYNYYLAEPGAVGARPSKRSPSRSKASKAKSGKAAAKGKAASKAKAEETEGEEPEGEE